MKYDVKNQERNLYLPKQKPVIVSVPEQKFISLHGIGDPNGEGFKEKIETLYPVAYGLKFDYKKYSEDKDVEFDDYVVPPLEGVWSLTPAGQKLDHLDKNEFEYDIMIRIPDFIPAGLITLSIAATKEKKNPSLIDELEIKTYPAMEAAEILHHGSYDEEPASFLQIDEFVVANNKKRASKIHREIYLSDARRVDKDKLKTVLRYRIK
ncbi:GyrI-like domain-containing protein [Companilactobacillus ginsenosidimutans]|uniref:GyrI-like small molecule binding domain-containing protein n=1 Tax=Companilactobacillus ginsenosidimutans TaxID=1007676 RepID=A0A0H4QJE7_9LACO|nr:GyrI-like domain-containing protein [Companilactobacillus ginsenosidimutans]AKP67166.1 hypothetical protein ABM34_06195 [Companilactobacillus ginsenosidimutans]